jgi:F0F1-type ATP synthase membrane subunit b/b'
MAPFSLTARSHYGHDEELASFASLEEAEEALSSLYDALEEASLSRSYILQGMIAELEEQVSEARLCAEAEAEEALS